MSTRGITHALLLALPIAGASFLTLARYVSVAPDSGFRHPSGPQLDILLRCINGDVTAFLRLSFDPPLRQAPVASLSNGEPLTCWLTDEQGGQWLNIGASAPVTQQPKRFKWQSGVELHLKLTNPTAISRWEIHRDGEKPDSTEARRNREFYGGATFLLLLLSGAAGLYGPKLLATEEKPSGRRCIEMLIADCSVPMSRSETKKMQYVLRAVVLDGEKLRAVLADMAGDTKRNGTIAIRAGAKLRAKLDTLDKELAVYRNRLGKHDE